MKVEMTTMKRLEMAKADLVHVRDVHDRAAGVLKIAKERTDPQKLVEAERWAKITSRKLSEAELLVKTLEVEVQHLSRSAKGCLTPSGKRIRV
jgi:hypothetical protein